MASLRRIAFMAALVCVLPPGMATASPQAAVVLVDYDMATASQHGEFPSRLQLARLTERLHAAGARSVLLKFFFDGPGDPAGNAALAKSLAQGRSLLQASISGDPPTSRALDARFQITTPMAGVQPAIQGSEGWLPLPLFAQTAAALCFADIQHPDRVPLFESFAGKPVPTLAHCLLSELTGGRPPELKPGLARFGAQQWAINSAGEIQVKLGKASDLARIPASRVLGVGQDWQAGIKGKVVVLMYTGPRSPLRDMQGKSMKVHEAFALQLGAVLAEGRTGAVPKRP